MPDIRLVTINILSDLSLWTQRSGLLAEGLEALKPDIIALQEVRLDKANAFWLADQLGITEVHQVPKIGEINPREGIAILSRLPVVDSIQLDLGSQGRVAQAVMVKLMDRSVWIANGHFFWEPGDSDGRLLQIERLIDWQKNAIGEFPLMIAGDFNGTPESKAIMKMKENFKSAYEQIHGKEPDWTAPTRLPRSIITVLSTAFSYMRFFRRSWFKDFTFGWQGTLDYIWINAGLRAIDCRLVLNSPDPHNQKIFPSDHIGLCADLEII